MKRFQSWLVLLLPQRVDMSASGNVHSDHLDFVLDAIRPKDGTEERRIAGQLLYELPGSAFAIPKYKLGSHKFPHIRKSKGWGHIINLISKPSISEPHLES